MTEEITFPCEFCHGPNHSQQAHAYYPFSGSEAVPERYLRKQEKPQGSTATAFTVREASRSYELRFAHGRAIIHRTDDCAEIVDLFVDEDHRGQGLGKAYVEQALEWCAVGLQGISTVVAHVAPHNEPSMRSFVGQGFAVVRSELHLELKLNEWSREQRGWE
jgi:GNAT superfamily N-acetyltransferase